MFIGYNPGLESARQGHYYAFRGNAFWRQLSASGLVARAVGPEDDALLQEEAGLGFTDLCRRPTLRASDLTAQEIAGGAVRLARELLDTAPRVAVFSGRGIYGLFGAAVLGLRRSDFARRDYGPQPETFDPRGFRSPNDKPGACAIWVVPSSSGLASKWHSQRLKQLQTLAGHLNGN